MEKGKDESLEEQTTSTTTSSESSSGLEIIIPEYTEIRQPFVGHDPVRFSWFAWGVDWLGWTLSWVRLSPFVFPKNNILKIAKEISMIKSPILGDLSNVYKSFELFVNGPDWASVPQVTIGIVGSNFTSFAETGLKVAKYIENHPEIAETPMKDALFVSGLPRTGTTLLHGLLAADVKTRAAYLFEISHLVDPVPPAPSRKSLETDPRREQLRKKMDEMHKFLPGFWERVGQSHYSAPEVQDEELFVMYWAGMFLAHSFVAGKKYIENYFSPDKDWIYRWIRGFYQALNHSWAPESHWVLKCPVHSLWIDSLSNVFPGSRLVFTHRDPAETIPSYCALEESYVGHFWYPGKLNRASIGRFVMDMWKLAAKRTLEWQKRTDPKSFINIHYQEVTKDPIGTVRRLYDFFGIPLLEESVQSMKQWLEDNPQGKHGRRFYTPEMYGLTAEGIRAEFKEYIDTFCSPPKNSN